jgi:hypothetical protein
LPSRINCVPIAVGVPTVRLIAVGPIFSPICMSVLLIIFFLP